MKKLLGLLGTIMITGNAIPSVIAAAPNRKHNIKKRQNNENISTTSKTQDEQQSQFSAISDSEVDIIEKEITLDENYSENIKKILKEFMKNRKIDPLRMINNEGIVRTDYFETQDKRNEREYNIKIIEKLDEILELRKFDANKIRILVLTLKNKENNEIKLIINLDNFYVHGFINNEDQYFYFKEEKSLNEWRQEIKKLTEKLNEWNKINEEIKLLDLKKINNNHHIINKIDEIKENLKKQLGTKENKEKIDLLNKNLFDQIQINNEDSESISKLLNELKENVEKLEKEKIYLGQEKINAYQKIQQIRQKSINLLNKINKTVKLDKKEYEENIKKYQWNNVFNKITSIIESKINTIQHKKIKENKINEEIIKKYSINKNKKHILNYNGSYQNKGLNVVNQNIDITKRNLNNAITNLSFLNKENNQNQITKDDLARVIFITSEAMRFGSYLKYFNYEKDSKQVEFKNIQENIQNIINSKNDDKIQWKDYSEQLIGGWVSSSKYVEEKRKEILKKLSNEIAYSEIKNKIFNDKKFIEKYNFKIHIKTEEFITKLKEVSTKYNHEINIYLKTKELKKIGLDRLTFDKAKKYYEYIRNNNFEKVLEDLNQKPEFMIKIKQNKITKEDICNEIKTIVDRTKIDILMRNEVFEFLISKHKNDLDKINSALKKIMNKLGLDKEKKDYIIEHHYIDAKESIIECEIIPTVHSIAKLNFEKISCYFLNKTFSFFPEIKYYKDEHFLSSITRSYNEDIFELVLLKNNNIKREILSDALIGAINHDNLKIIKLLIENGANPNLADENGETSLFVAVKRDGDLEIIKELLANGADVNLKNIDDFSPLYIAMKIDSEEIVKILIENGADVNESVNGKTLLWYSVFCYNDNINITNYLINNSNISINILDDAVLELFSKNNHNIIKILKQKLNSKGIKITDEKIKEKVQKYKENKGSTEKKIHELLLLLKSLSINPNSHYLEQCKNNGLFLIKNHNLGEISDNRNKTILNTLIEKNEKLKKLFSIDQLINRLYVTNITNDSAIINSPVLSTFETGAVRVPVTFTIKKEIQHNKSQKKIIENEYKKQGARPKGSEMIHNQPYNTDNSKASIGGGESSVGIQQQNTMYDVPADNSCLFWSVATAYLLPVRNNSKEFKKRFIQLFGEAKLINSSHIQKLLQQFDLENHSNNQLWYNDETSIRLIRTVFRNRVVNYIIDNLDDSTQINQVETFRNAIQISENEIAINYLERMREENTWGGEIEILGMSNFLNSNIVVNNNTPYQPVNQNSNNNIQIFHVNGNHYNFGLENQNRDGTNTKNKSASNSLNLPKKKGGGQSQSGNIDKILNKPITTNIANLQETTTKKTINKYNSLSKEEKQQKLNEINQYYQSLSENQQKALKDKLRDVGLGLTSTGISGAGILGISKMTGISPIKGLSTTANYIKNSLSTTRTVVSSGTGEAVEMTPLLSESTVAEGLTAAETLSTTEGAAFVATEGAVIGTEASTAAALAPETLGLSLLIGGLVIAGTAILWWINSDHTIVKHESHNQYNEIEKYYKFLSHDQLKLDINISEWDKIKQIYQKNSNNYQEFKNKIKSEITNFHKEEHSGWGGSITDEDINTLINILYNHFQEINNHFLSNPNHGWKIITNTVGSYFIIEEE